MLAVAHHYCGADMRAFDVAVTLGRVLLPLPSFAQENR